MPDTSTGVVVIGGGSTGAGVLRDLTLRGIDAVLVENGDLASGTTGRSHGLLHSGGRYCVNDEQAAIECVEEGRILRRIARSTVEDTGGYFVSVTEEDHEWEPRFVEGCRRTGITCERISVAEARRREPALSRHVRSAFWVPEDGHLDPFYLVVGNVESARRRGARVMTHTEVTGFLREGDRLTGVPIRDSDAGDAGLRRGTPPLRSRGGGGGPRDEPQLRSHRPRAARWHRGIHLDRRRQGDDVPSDGGAGRRRDRSPPRREHAVHHGAGCLERSGGTPRPVAPPSICARRSQTAR